MEKKLFKIELRSDATKLCDEIAILAAQANGGVLKGCSLNDLKKVCEVDFLKYPALYHDTTVSIVGDYTLVIDRKIKDEYKTVCTIQEVTVFETEMPAE